MPRTLSLLLVLACNEPGADFVPPPDDVVIASFQELHGRVYDAYSVGVDRNKLHDLLERSFSGRALTEEYVEHFVTASRMAKEETSIEVFHVDYTGVEIAAWDQERVTLVADWSVGGVVTHREHKHPRVNRYRATFDLEWSDEPRIVRSQIQRLERVRGAFGGSE